MRITQLKENYPGKHNSERPDLLPYYCWDVLGTGRGKLRAHIPSNGPASNIPKPREGLGTGNGKADAHRSG